MRTHTKHTILILGSTPGDAQPRDAGHYVGQSNHIVVVKGLRPSPADRWESMAAGTYTC